MINFGAVDTEKCGPILNRLVRSQKLFANFESDIRKNPLVFNWPIKTFEYLITTNFLFIYSILQLFSKLLLLFF